MTNKALIISGQADFNQVFKSFDILVQKVQTLEKAVLRPMNNLKSSISDALNASMYNRGGFVSPMEQFNLATKKTTGTVHTMQTVVDNTLKSMDKDLKELRNNLALNEKAARKFQAALLGAGLSFLFTGMAIKRTLDGIFKSVFNTYQLATDQTSEFDLLTNRLIANWEFFKFTLVDALMQTGLLQGFIEFLIRILKKFQELSPETKKWIMILVAGGIVLGAVMMLVGQSMLGVLGLIVLANGLGLTLGSVFFAIGIVLGVLIGLFAIWTSDMTPAQKKVASFGLVLVALTVGFVALGGAISGVLFAWFALFAVFILLKEKFGSDWWKAWLSGIAMAIAAVVGIAVEAILIPVRIAAKAILDFISLVNRIPGVHINTDGGILESLTKPGSVFESIMSYAAQGLNAIGMTPKEDKDTAISDFQTKQKGFQDALLTPTNLVDTTKMNEQISVFKDQLNETTKSNTSLSEIEKTLKEIKELQSSQGSGTLNINLSNTGFNKSDIMAVVNDSIDEILSKGGATQN